MVNRQRDLLTNEDAHLVSMDVRLTKDEDVARLAATKATEGSDTDPVTSSEASG